MQSNQPGYSEGGAAPAYQPPVQQQAAYNPAAMQQQPVQHAQPQQPVQYVQQPMYQPQPQVIVQQPVQQQQPQQQVIYVQQQPAVTQQVVVANPKHMPRGPTTALCAKCQTNVTTQTRMEDGCGTWLICGGICLAGFWCGCCLIPFCMDDCKDVIHTCTRCGTVVGSRKIVNM
mmetsp:Transcript_53028/g.47660  ORF Transcript_53028/g.47660 Transcript_53028/m.47660 type:complete len:173 (+) Transcript_53028:91-609(+)